MADIRGPDGHREDAAPDDGTCDAPPPHSGERDRGSPRESHVRFRWGQSVRTVTDLLNDGSHPHSGADALLVASGTRGEVVQTGMHEESNTPVYIVEFPDGKVVGCLEDELEPAQPG